MSPLGFAACQSKKCTNIKFSHRFHRFTQKFIAEKRLPQNIQISQKFIAEKRLPQNSQNSQKFIAEKRLPQNTQISQKFIAEKRLPQKIHRFHRSLLLRRDSHRKYTDFTEVYS